MHGDDQVDSDEALVQVLLEDQFAIADVSPLS
jgi:hypothetical protein